MSEHLLTRRGALTGLGGLAVSGAIYPQARAATTLTVISHEAHKAAATTGPGGDVLAAWRQANNCEVNWITMDVVAAGDRYQREASLSRTSVDAAFQIYCTNRVLSLSEPLEPYIAADPIPGVGPHYEDLPQGLVQDVTYQGALRGIPVRVAVIGVCYNETIFAERGITSVPTTFEELVDTARKLTFTRADGSKVYGFMFSGGTELAGGYTAIARCFGGDYIAPDLTLHASDPGTLRSLEVLAQMYKEGIIPPETITGTQEDLFTWGRQGRAAIVAPSLARVPGLNDPKGSKYPGKIAVMAWPQSVSMAGKPQVTEAEFWALVMPHNGAPERRKLAWSFIRELSTTEAAVRMGMNGNGPTRLSAYDDPRLASVPFLKYTGAGMKYGQPALPPFPNGAKAQDIFVAECQLAVLGRKTPKEAMDDATARVKPLMT